VLQLRRLRIGFIKRIPVDIDNVIALELDSIAVIQTWYANWVIDQP